MTAGESNFQWRAIDFFHLSVFSFGSSAFSASLGVVVLPVLVLAMAPEEFKNTYLGILSLAGLVVAMVTQPLAGHISDRASFSWGRRTPYIMAGSLLTCLSVSLLGVASNFFVLAVGLILTQLCINIALGPYQALIRDVAPQRQRGAASSFKVLADSSGGVIFLVLIAFLLGRYSKPGSAVWLWLSLAAMAFILVAAAAWTVITIRAKEARIIPAASPRPQAEQDKVHSHFGWFLGSRFCCIAALAAMQTYAVYFLRDVVGLTNPVEAVGLLALVAGGSLFLAAYPAGRLSDLIGRKPVIVASVLVGAGGAFCLLLAGSFLQVLLVGSLLGVAAAAFFSASWAMATDLVSSASTAQQMGIANTAAVAGSALARLAGPGVDLLNHVNAGLGYSALAVMCGVFFIFGALLLIPVRTGERLKNMAHLG